MQTSPSYRIFTAANDNTYIKRLIADGYDSQHHCGQDHLHDHDGPTGFYKCHPAGRNYALSALEDDDLKDAGIICFGGIEQIGMGLGALGSGIDALLGKKSSIVFHSLNSKDQRFADAYKWNMDKSYISDEIAEAADKFWQERFCENGRLKKPEDISPLVIFTYSFGSRMALMLENALRKKLEATGCDDKKIQAYFDRIRRISIASAVDCEGMPPEQPRIESRSYISVNDVGVCYRESFFKSCMEPVLQNAERMGIFTPVPKTTVVVMGEGMVPPVHHTHPNTNGHGFGAYVEGIMKNLLTEKAALQEFANEPFQVRSRLW